MKIVILQPMFIPWAGVFEQIRLCDVFVHFDDVPLPQGRSFCSRVQLKTPAGQQWLTAPLVRSSRGLIKDVHLDHSVNWKADHLKMFATYLSKAPYWSECHHLLEKIFNLDTDSLASFNMNSIEMIASYLGLKKPFLKSSDLNVNGTSSQKLLNILKELKGTSYITGHGAKNYLEHENFEQQGVDVEYVDYKITPYDQFYPPFIPYISIIDLIAHNGPNGVQLLQSKTVNWKEFVNG